MDGAGLTESPPFMSQATPGDAMTGRSRPEAELLLHCARLHMDAGTRERIVQLLDAPLDWACLIELAMRHGLRPLLFRHLDAVEPHAVPRDAFVALWAWRQRVAAQNRLMVQELLRLLQLFEAQEIPALPFKGPALAQSVYGDVALREFADLDILMRAGDIPKAQQVLAEAGYRPEYTMDELLLRTVLSSGAHYHLAFVHAESSMMVELHWKTDALFPVEEAASTPWWTRSPDAVLAGAKVRSFNSSELLLALCVHGSKHHWASLGWLVDVAELVRAHQDLDWEWIMMQAARLGCKRRVAVGLALARELLAAPLPPGVERWTAAQDGCARMRRQLLRMLFESPDQEMNGPRRLAVDLTLIDRGVHRARHVLNVVFAPTLHDWTAQPPGAGARFLRYPLRLARLVRKYLPAAGRSREA